MNARGINLFEEEEEVVDMVAGEVAKTKKANKRKRVNGEPMTSAAAHDQMEVVEGGREGLEVGEYHVEAILDRRIVGRSGRVEYLIKWLNYEKYFASIFILIFNLLFFNFKFYYL